MRKILYLLVILILAASLFSACSSKTSYDNAKSEEELRSEIKAEMEAEAKEKAKEKAASKPQEESKTTTASTANVQVKKEEVDKEPVKKEATKSSETALIYSNNKDYWEYKPNTKVSTDLDGDGKNEEVLFDTNKGKLFINSYSLDLNKEMDAMFMDTSSFVIIDYSDKYWKQGEIGRFIGIKNFGPSSDNTTTFYVYWTEVNGKKMDNPIFSVGIIEGLISRSDTYDNSNPDDFNSKAILTKEGISAPVRLNVVQSQTWYGRNIFTYYSTYKYIINNIDKYDRDYDTNVGLLQKAQNLYFSEKDKNSSSLVVKGNQNIRMTKTDDKAWIYIEADDGSTGWVPAETIKEPEYEGFSVFD